ncbi:MAG: GAF domain-containing protein, partial [bacterium]|nr:GAF domain-containing protein [bacterium]
GPRQAGPRQADRVARDHEGRAEADLRTVNAFAISLLQQNTLEDLLWSMAESIGRLLGFEDCVIYLREGERLVQTAAYGALAPESREFPNPIALRLGEGIAGNVARTGVAEIVRDTRTDPRYVADDFGGLSELTVPILFEGRVLGIIDTERSWVDGFSEADRDVLQSIANIASSRIASALADRERRKAEEALKKAHDELERRVEERTAELRRAVAELEQENAQRRTVEQALAQEKERLAVTLRSIGEGIIAADRQGRILFLSDAAESLVGWPREEALGQPLKEVFQLWREGKKRVRDDPMARVLSAAAGVSEPASRRVLVRRDGSERLITGTGAPILSEQGAVIGVVLVLRDVTREQRVEEEAKKAQRLEPLGILAGGIAHDFNNLLTAILGNVNLAQRYVPSEGLEAEILAEAHEACLRARDLTKQLLTFASGGAPVKRTGSIVDLLRDSVRFALRGSNVRCEFSIADDLHPVDMDAGQINTVLNNLVINADQAMAEGGLIRVSASNHVLDPDTGPDGRDGSSILISIEDHGTGIPAEYLERIFDPYFTTKGKDGTGLGLSTAYSIIREHDGTLAVDSEPEAGTTFHLCLPASEKAAPPPPPIPLPIPPAGGGRILLMDDEETVRASVTQMLQLLGYRVTVARDGEQAIRLFAEAHQGSDPFKAVVLDLTIPGGMGGKEVISHLQAVDSDVRAVVASGYCNDPVMADYHSYGFRGIIEKPFSIRELGQVIAEAVAEAVAPS